MNVLAGGRRKMCVALRRDLQMSVQGSRCRRTSVAPLALENSRAGRRTIIAIPVCHGRIFAHRVCCALRLTEKAALMVLKAQTNVLLKMQVRTYVIQVKRVSLTIVVQVCPPMTSVRQMEELRRMSVLVEGS